MLMHTLKPETTGIDGAGMLLQTCVSDEWVLQGWLYPTACDRLLRQLSARAQRPGLLLSLSKSTMWAGAPSG